MRISDWSSDVCSSDLFAHARMTDEPGEVWRKGRNWLLDAMLFSAVDPNAPKDSADGEADQNVSDASFEEGGARRGRPGFRSRYTAAKILLSVKIGTNFRHYTLGGCK